MYRPSAENIIRLFLFVKTTENRGCVVINSLATTRPALGLIDQDEEAHTVRGRVNTADDGGQGEGEGVLAMH